MKSRPGLKLSHPEKLSLTVNIIGKIKIPSKTKRPGIRKTNLCLKFITKNYNKKHNRLRLKAVI
jgi:hypothetical protein